MIVKVADVKTCPLIYLQFWTTLKAPGSALKESMSRGVPQRPSNPDFLKTRTVHFATLFKTRHRHIMEFIFLEKKFGTLNVDRSSPTITPI